MSPYKIFPKIELQIKLNTVTITGNMNEMMFNTIENAIWMTVKSRLNIDMIMLTINVRMVKIVEIMAKMIDHRVKTIVKGMLMI